MLILRANGGVGRTSPGAGRLIDLTWPLVLNATWPANAASMTGAMANALSVFGRAGQVVPEINTVSSNQTGVGSTVLSGGADFGHRPAIVYKPGTGGGGTGIYNTVDAFTINPVFGDSGPQGSDFQDDDMACFRWLAYLYFPGNQATYTGDTGFIVSTDNLGQRDITNGGCGGFGFSQTANNELSFVRRFKNAGAYTKTVLMTQALAQWHEYEMRLIGARKSANAKLKVLLDGSLVLSLDWVADNLTDTQNGNGAFGLYSTLVAHGAGAGAAGFAVSKLRFMAAPTEDSLL